MSDFICVAHMIIPAISPQSDAFAALPDVRPGEPRRHPFLVGELKNEQCQDNKKRHHQHGNGVSIAILVYSIIPYLRQKVQENRYFTRFLPVIHSFYTLLITILFRPGQEQRLVQLQ